MGQDTQTVSVLPAELSSGLLLWTLWSRREAGAASGHVPSISKVKQGRDVHLHRSSEAD